MRAHSWSLSEMRFHSHICLIIHSVEILLKVMGVVLLSHFLFELVIESIGFLIGGVWLSGILESRHFLIVLS